MKSLLKKRTIKFVSLLLSLGLVISFMQNWLLVPMTSDPWRIKGYRMENKDTLDVLFLGASDVFAGFSSAYAYGLEGFTSYPYAVSACPVTLWKTMLKDALVNQSPQLIVVETSCVWYEGTKSNHYNAALHNVLDNMPLSVRKISHAFREQRFEPVDNAQYFLFPILKYHNMIKDAENLEKNYRNMKAMYQRGYALLRGVYSIPLMTPPASDLRDISQDFSEVELDAEVEDALREFLEYCLDHDLNVLFTEFPHQIGTEKEDPSYEKYKKANRAERIIREYGFPFLSLERLSKEIGLDPDRDFYNADHVSIRGQQKLTNYLASYLVRECGVTPRPQTAENKAAWERSAEYYQHYCLYVEEQIKQNPSTEAIVEKAELISILDEKH